MHHRTSILKFDRVAIDSNPLYESAVWNITFEIARGELLLILLDSENRLLPLADAAEGLVRPREGRVTFLGEDWNSMDAETADRRRMMIGRIFPERGWISNLDVDENITLAQRHHTRRDPAAIVEEAAVLSRQFGLPGLPLGKVTRLRRQDLQKAACVRAFLGSPQLILAEDPTREVYADIIAPLVNMLFLARQRGAAILWATSNPKVWNDSGIRPTGRCRMTGSHMHIVERTDRCNNASNFAT